ncbi:hypothetical protein ACQB6R_13540 [Propionibacteriaceae bacterium G1746]|uniref:hypothetical protein n=1 Tax=Aestuariimicrobium sp. G57 TaxID=3418485 RepID=UPI003C1B06AD
MTVTTVEPWTTRLLPDSVSRPSSAERANEDAVRVGPGLAVVVDGAGVDHRFRAGCQHSVSWYANKLADALYDRFHDRRLGPREALALAIGHVRNLHGAACILQDGSPSATVAAFRTHGDKLEYMVLCDAAVLLVPSSDEPQLVTDTLVEGVAARASTYREELRTRGVPETMAAESTARFVEMHRNHPEGFWVAQDDPKVADHAISASVPLEGLRAVVACSDGITRALDRLALHDVASLATALVDSPLGAVVDEIRAAEDDGTDRPGKRHDDATAAVLRFG